MSQRGIDKPGWLLKQFADLERESEKWPERMKRAVAEKMLQSAGIDPEQVGKDIRPFAWETMQAAALLGSLPEPAEQEQADEEEPTRYCSLCEGQYIHDRCDGFGLGPPEPAEQEQAAQDEHGGKGE